MKISFPHMGHAYLPLKTAFQQLDIPVVVPPPISKRTLSLGTKHSPETICLPFKITLGNMIEALDAGADTLVMAAGRGLCRFGYYARVQERILKEDLGYDFEMITTDLFGGKMVGVAKLMKRLSNGAPTLEVIRAIHFGLTKLHAVEEVEREVHRVRAVELDKGQASGVYREAQKALDEAQDRDALRETAREYLARLRQVPQNPQAHPLKVGVIGEFYVVLEPFSNMDIEVELGKLGVWAQRSLFISEWTNFSLIFSAFGLSDKAKFHKAAQPYLRRDVGGDGWETVGEKVYHARDYDGLVHLAPFTCMPEIIAQNILPSTPGDIPLLTIICDEQMGKAGMVTRLEAFVDLLKRRRRRPHSLARAI